MGANNAELRFPTVVNTGGSNFATAIYNGYAAPRLTHVTATASGGDSNYGVANSDSSPTMQNVTASASGGGDCYGVRSETSSLTIQNSSLSASGGTSNYGVYNITVSGSCTVRINNSQVITASTATIRNDTGFTTLVGASLLAGGAVTGGGVTCAGVYDEDYTFYASTCP